MNRRLFLARASAATVLAAGISAPGHAAASRGKRFFAAHGLPIGLQLYTLGPNLDRDFDGTLAAVSKIGYAQVELAGMHGRSAQELRQAFDAHRLSAVSIHVPGTNLFGSGHYLDGDLAALAADAHTMGITDVVMPIFLMPAGFKPPEGADARTMLVAAGNALKTDDYRHMAEFLNDKAARLAKLGLKLSYHNHNFELAPLPNGSTGLDILLEKTDPRLVNFEIDVGWISAAGRNPVEFLRAHPRRFTQMHVKDIKATTKPNYSLEQDPTEVGSGSIRWRDILPVAWRAGVRRYFVEQEPPYERERLDAIAISFQYLSSKV
jgi:sugar phosphate isomerase/epimerase